MAQYSFTDFVKTNIAPKEAKYIGVYNSAGDRVGEIPLGELENTNGTPLYKFGILSDIHVDTTDYNYQQYLNSYPYSDEGASDLRRALRWFRDVEHVDMVCASGDLSQQGTDTEYTQSQTEIANEIPNIPFYTCTGNHDVYNGHSGAPTFRNFFNNRSIDTTSHTLSASTAYQNSFYFDHTFQNSSGQNQTDTFIFFSMYNYSAGDAYLTDDLTWLSELLLHKKNNRIFLFTHLFFPDYAGNLGRVNGSGGIYPTGNWLSGDGLTRLLNMLRGYNHVYWFSGHSHWKWDLQRFQNNINVARYGTAGAWTIHIPSLALPIDSDYTNLSTETSTNRVEKPLESQGGVVDVYDDRIVVRGIDFNINSSQNGDTTQGYSGDTYVRYLPIAHYDLKLGLYDGDGENINMGIWEYGGFDGATELDYNSGVTEVIRSQYIPVSATNLYLLTTVAPIGDRSNENSIRELSIWCFSGNETTKTQLGRINGHSYNTVSSKWGSSGTSLNYFDRVYTDEDISNGIFNTYPETTYIRMRLYRMGTEADPEGTGSTITLDYGDRVQLKEIVGERHPETAATRPTSEYVIASNFSANSNKPGGQVFDPWNDHGDAYADYVALTFTSTSQGFWVTSPTYSSAAGTSQTASLVVDDLQVYNGDYASVTPGVSSTISLPSNVGFYNGNGYSGSARYQIATGFPPSTTENSSNGRVQFQTSSSYGGGTITIFMKVKVNFTQ